MLAARINERDWTLARTAWRQGFVISSIVMPALFLAAMGLGLGGVIDDSQRSIAGLSYLHFVAPGLLVASAMQQAGGDSMWPVMGGAKWDRRYHAMIATPLAPTDIQQALLNWVAFRTTVSSTGFLLVATVLGGIVSPWGVLAIPVAALTAVAFAAVLSAFAIIQESDATLSLVYRLGLMPLFLFSGTFFPISVLPSGVRPLAWLSPLWHGVELARHATTADAHWAADVTHLVVLLGVVVLATLWGRHNFTRKLTT